MKGKNQVVPYKVLSKFLKQLHAQVLEMEKQQE